MVLSNDPPRRLDYDAPGTPTLVDVMRNGQRVPAVVETGKLLWEVKLTANAQANPITYAGKSGKQYVVVDAGDNVIAFLGCGACFSLPSSHLGKLKHAPPQRLILWTRVRYRP